MRYCSWQSFKFYQLSLTENSNRDNSTGPVHRICNSVCMTSHILSSAGERKSFSLVVRGNISIRQTREHFRPFGVTGRLLEPVPAAHGWRQGTPEWVASSPLGPKGAFGGFENLSSALQVSWHFPLLQEHLWIFLHTWAWGQNPPRDWATDARHINKASSHQGNFYRKV